MNRGLLSKKVAQQFVRYFAVAGVGLAVDFGTVIFTKQVLGFYYLLAVCCGFILGLIFTYFFSNKFVFGAPKGDHRKVFLLFGVVGLVGLGILNILMLVLTGWLGVNYIVAKALATVVVFAWNFLARRTLFHNEELEQVQPV
ncbi:MAG TPA: GtrA family protein [Candidatus Saccharimonadales bacterium]|nr:GtrA family protein [Candidatus Saccharimonadales bacterium]